MGLIFFQRVLVFIWVYVHNITYKEKNVWAMPKNYNLRKLMIELLEKRELSKIELFDEVRKNVEN